MIKNFNFNKNKLLFNTFIFLSIFLLIFLIFSNDLIVNAESSEINFYDSLYEQIQVGWSDMDDVGTGNSYVAGANLTTRYNENRGVSFYTSNKYLHYANGIANKPSNFNISTMSSAFNGEIEEPFASINTKYSGTIFSFYIELNAHCYSDDSTGTVYGTDIEDIKIWEDYMNAKFFIDRTDRTKVLVASDIKFVVKEIKPSYFRVMFEYDFIVPESGVDLYGFQFNFPCKFILGTETDFYVQPVFLLSNINLNSYNYPLAGSPIDINSDNLFDFSSELYNNLDWSIYNSVPKYYSLFVNSWLWVCKWCEDIFFDIPVLNLLLWFSLIIGILSFIVGLAPRVVSSFDSKNERQSKSNKERSG